MGQELEVVIVGSGRCPIGSLRLLRGCELVFRPRFGRQVDPSEVLNKAPEFSDGFSKKAARPEAARFDFA